MIDDSASSLILHTVLDGETLVRTIIGLDIVDVVSSPQQGELLIEHRPNGVSVLTPGTPSSMDNNVPKTTLFRQAFGMEADGVKHIEVDLSGMRKLNPDDTIALRFVSTAEFGARMTGSILLMFKE